MIANGASLPWADGVAEVDQHVGGESDFFVFGHLHALVTGRGPSQVCWQLADCVDESIADVLGAVAVGQVHEHAVPAAAFHEGADRRSRRGPADEAPFPVPRNGSVVLPRKLRER